MKQMRMFCLLAILTFVRRARSRKAEPSLQRPPLHLRRKRKLHLRLHPLSHRWWTAR